MDNRPKVPRPYRLPACRQRYDPAYKWCGNRHEPFYPRSKYHRRLSHSRWSSKAYCSGCKDHEADTPCRSDRSPSPSPWCLRMDSCTSGRNPDGSQNHRCHPSCRNGWHPTSGFWSCRHLRTTSHIPKRNSWSPENQKCFRQSVPYRLLQSPEPDHVLPDRSAPPYCSDPWSRYRYSSRCARLAHSGRPWHLPAWMSKDRCRNSLTAHRQCRRRPAHGPVCWQWPGPGSCNDWSDSAADRACHPDTPPGYSTFVSSIGRWPTVRWWSSRSSPCLWTHWWCIWRSIQSPWRSAGLTNRRTFPPGPRGSHSGIRSRSARCRFLTAHRSDPDSIEFPFHWLHRFHRGRPLTRQWKNDKP